MINKLVLVIFFLCSFVCFSQNNEDINPDTKEINVIVQDSITKKPIDPLTPSKAAFYSAILPGLGQAYNKKYWKIPLVYAGLGTGLYFYLDNNKQYNRYRDAYKRRLAGFTDDEFWGEGSVPSISDDGLIRAQRTFRRNKDISLLVTIGIYALNIIDANVDAHLLQYNVDEDLAIKPHFKFNELDATTNFGLTLNFKIN
ncbi:DUF5683 domain-containing protein [Flavobacteriaceae sp. LMIT009]